MADAAASAAVFIGRLILAVAGPIRDMTMHPFQFERLDTDAAKATLGIAAAACLLLCGGAAHAQASGPEWDFSGFGTAGVAWADTDQADFVSTTLKPHGAGYTHRVSPNVDSRLGAQLSVNLDARWSAVLQVVTEQGMDRRYRPHVEWANVKYQVTPDLSVRLGRIALPMYLAADYRKVGYAYTYARTPAEVYNRVPVTFSDGIDASYRWRSGAVKHRVQASFGHNETELLRDYMLYVRALTGLAYTVETGALTVSASALTARVSSNIGADLFGAFRAFGAAGNAIADRYNISDKRVGSFSVGFSYDPGTWYVMGEAGTSNGKSLLARSRGGYLSAGWRHGNLTPYGVLAWTAVGEPTSIAGVPTAGLPARAAATATALNAGLNHYLGSIPEQSSLAVGVRWDFMPNVALKLQADHLRPKAGTRGTMINDQPGFRDGRSVNVASAALDFVF